MIQCIQTDNGLEFTSRFAFSNRDINYADTLRMHIHCRRDERAVNSAACRMKTEPVLENARREEKSQIKPHYWQRTVRPAYIAKRKMP